MTVRVCRECGCTDDNACVTDNGPCHWVAPDLCSRCAADAYEASHGNVPIIAPELEPDMSQILEEEND